MKAPNKNVLLISGAFLVVILGVLGAWLISSKSSGSQSPEAAPGVKVTSNEAGALDSKVEYDEVEGDLKDGGVGNEGTHHLERQGGSTQNVYLTSSVIDLSTFVGKKVKVWGQTLASKKAGWLMDVAKVQIVQ